MKPLILLMDEDQAFMERVASRLTRLAGQDYGISIQTQLVSQDSRDKSLRDQASLLLAPSSWKERPAFQACLKSAPVLYWDDPPALRFSGAPLLDQAIRERIKDKLGGPEADQGLARMGCQLAFSEAAGQALTAHLMAREMALGKRLIYLPIKPLYKISDPFRRGPEASLGDLLCLMASGNPPPARELGLWLYLHEKGYFTFRLPERADDLTACDLALLKDLVGLVKAYAASGSEPTVIWIDSQDLPLEKLSALAGLCDFVYVHVPQEESSAARLAKRELSLFLAQLPSSCAIYEASGKSGGLDIDRVRRLDHVAHL